MPREIWDAKQVLSFKISRTCSATNTNGQRCSEILHRCREATQTVMLGRLSITPPIWGAVYPEARILAKGCLCAKHTRSTERLLVQWRRIIEKEMDRICSIGPFPFADSRSWRDRRQEYFEAPSAFRAMLPALRRGEFSEPSWGLKQEELQNPHLFPSSFSSQSSTFTHKFDRSFFHPIPYHSKAAYTTSNMASHKPTEQCGANPDELQPIDAQRRLHTNHSSQKPGTPPVTVQPASPISSTTFVHWLRWPHW